jgi:hypothetical protein
LGIVATPIDKQPRPTQHAHFDDLYQCTSTLVKIVEMIFTSVLSTLVKIVEM